MQSEFLDILRCPDCSARLFLVEEANLLQCHGCNRQFPVCDGIPVLLPLTDNQPRPSVDGNSVS